MRYIIEKGEKMMKISISICYAAESKEDVWISGQTYAELMCVTDTWDATSDPEFYFSNNDPFV